MIIYISATARHQATAAVAGSRHVHRTTGTRSSKHYPWISVHQIIWWSNMVRHGEMLLLQLYDEDSMPWMLQKPY
jgi:hypothetical protein